MVDAGQDVSARLVELINTRHCPDGDDALADGRAALWLHGWLDDGGGRAAAPAAVDRRRLADLRTLREGLRQLAAVNNEQHGDDGMVDRAAAVLRSVPVRVELGDGAGGPLLGAAGDADVATLAIVRLAGHYLTARASGAWSRVKACAAPDCRWAYLDAARNRSRRWCDMAECGNRAKNRAWRERQARGPT